MNKRDYSTERVGKSPYSPPVLEIIDLGQGFSILEIVSLEGEIYDFEDGDDF